MADALSEDQSQASQIPLQAQTQTHRTTTEGGEHVTNVHQTTNFNYYNTFQAS